MGRERVHDQTCCRASARAGSEVRSGWRAPRGGRNADRLRIWIAASWPPPVSASAAARSTVTQNRPSHAVSVNTFNPRGHLVEPLSGCPHGPTRWFANALHVLDSEKPTKLFWPRSNVHLQRSLNECMAGMIVLSNAYSAPIMLHLSGDVRDHHIVDAFFPGSL